GADITAEQVDSGFDPGCVKTLRGITAPAILSPLVMRRAKKRKNLSSARHYDQIRFRFHTTKTLTGHSYVEIPQRSTGISREVSSPMHLSSLAVAWTTLGSTLNYRGGSKSVQRAGRNGRKTDSIEIESPSKCRTSPHKRKTLAGLP